jgi:hypothetical protein
MPLQPPWEDEYGVQVLRLYRTKQYPDWAQDVNKKHFYPDWPRIVMLDLSAEQFDEFNQKPLAFAKNHNLFPEQPILWMTPCATPPVGEEVPRTADGSRWTVVIIHGPMSMATSAACPQSTTK